MSVQIVMVFETEDEALLALDYIGEADAPVMLDPRSRVVIGGEDAVVIDPMTGRIYQLWGDFNEARQDLLECVEVEES